MYSLIVHFETKEALDQLVRWLKDEGMQRYYEECLYDNKPCINLITSPVPRAYTTSMFFAVGLPDKRELDV